MKESVKYSFTVTLQPKWFKFTATEQYDMTFTPLYQILSSLSARFGCIAELTKAFNIHYHGVITFNLDENNKLYMKAFNDAFRKSLFFGFVNIKQITDEQGWINYLKKDLLDTKKLINRPPIINDWLISDSLIEDIDGMIQDPDNF